MTNTNHSLKSQYIAAIDLGSNSFHMVIGEELEHGNIKIIDRVKEMVRLNAGLDPQGDLTVDVQERALECLIRFRHRLETIPPERIRAVGTNTLRAAHNSAAFLVEAQKALGHRIAVVSGHEEARLVYLGAAFDLAGDGRQRLVVDIGGGSTELIVGKAYQPIRMDSLYMGCVSLSRRFFADGTISMDRLKQAQKVVLQELEPVITTYRQLGWQQAVGTSGTIKAVDAVSRELGLKQDWLSAESFDRIRSWLCACCHAENLDLVSEERRPVFAGGFVILATVFEVLGMERMDTSDGALREGVLYDLSDRLHDEDSRHLGVQSLGTQFNLDAGQFDRVEKTARLLFDQASTIWAFDLELDAKLLSWASRLHEIGIVIAYNQHHKHGAYIIENSNISGFSREIQRMLALLVRSHRQKIPVELFEALPSEWRPRCLRLALLLRLSVALHRNRSDIDRVNVHLKAKKKKIIITVPAQWELTHPLTLFDLETEQAYLHVTSYRLVIRTD